MKLLLIVLILQSSYSFGATYHPSGSPEVDQMREEVKKTPTTPENYQQRVRELVLWLNIAQQQSADTHSLSIATRPISLQNPGS